MPVSIDSLVTYLSHVRSGALRVLVVLSENRYRWLPLVPTAREQGLDVVISLWFAIMAPAGTSTETIARLNREVDLYLKHPETAKQFEPFAGQPLGGTKDDALKYLQKENVSWKRMIQGTGIKLD